MIAGRTSLRPRPFVGWRPPALAVSPASPSPPVDGRPHAAVSLDVCRQQGIPLYLSLSLSPFACRPRDLHARSSRAEVAYSTPTLSVCQALLASNALLNWSLQRTVCLFVYVSACCCWYTLASGAPAPAPGCHIVPVCLPPAHMAYFSHELLLELHNICYLRTLSHSSRQIAISIVFAVKPLQSFPTEHP